MPWRWVKVVELDGFLGTRPSVSVVQVHFDAIGQQCAHRARASFFSELWCLVILGAPRDATCQAYFEKPPATRSRYCAHIFQRRVLEEPRAMPTLHEDRIPRSTDQLPARACSARSA